MKVIVPSKICWFDLSLNVWSPYERSFVNNSSDNKLSSVLANAHALSSILDLVREKRWQRRRKCSVVSGSVPQEQIGLTGKLWRCLCKSLEPKRILVINLIPKMSSVLKIDLLWPNTFDYCQILARQEEIPQKTSKNISWYFCSSFQGHV